MYKDKDRQREADRERQRRHRAKSVTRSVTSQASCVTPVLTERGNIRVSKPGDADYVPQCETTRAFIEDRPKQATVKHVGSFDDLPLDVQHTIDSLSDTPQEKIRRTAIAIDYQHRQPDRYYSTGFDINMNVFNKARE